MSAVSSMVESFDVKEHCYCCGIVDDHYDEHSVMIHRNTPKHICNKILYDYNKVKKSFSGNRRGISIFGNVKTELEKTQSRITKRKIVVSIKPKKEAKFSFTITNEAKLDEMLVVGFQLGHPQPQFQMNDHPYVIGNEPYVLKNKSTLKDEVSVTFVADDIGQYEMPIMFLFVRIRDQKNIIIIREMVVYVQENPLNNTKRRNPYKYSEWHKTDHFKESTNHIIYKFVVFECSNLCPAVDVCRLMMNLPNRVGCASHYSIVAQFNPILHHPHHQPYENKYKIPYMLKIILPRGLNEKALEGQKLSPEVLQNAREVLIATRIIMEEGTSKYNYMLFFHHLLWWEEIIAKINLRKYNMTKMTLQKDKNGYLLEVPGLAEKRPSLLQGDRIYLRPSDQKKSASETLIFESVIKKLEDESVLLADFDVSFEKFYSETAEFDIRFIMSRVPMERMHEAVSKVFSSKQDSRVFPEPIKRPVPVQPIKKFYNNLIKNNTEQEAAVRHIVSGTSGLAPYIVFGPPGTGKTMTIVEAIIQLVVINARNRVLVCTDSNMAADHITLMLLKFSKVLNIDNFLLRVNSRFREWSVMAAELAPVSNGTNYCNCKAVRNAELASYRIVVTTLSHAAKYSSNWQQQQHKVQMSHLFIDEAAQASEPSTLIPITGLLAPTGQLILAGDPRQLGPFCVSKEAGKWGLGKSLLERLLKEKRNLYYKNSNYITMLVKNFRSDPDILRIPNSLFYDNKLQAIAKPDPLSRISILGLPGGAKAVVFHAVHSKEQRMGKAPSYFNEKELDMLKRYIKALIVDHKVLPEDIGVIAPYIRQVYKMKAWLMDVSYDKIEVGTVEAFQGKEKRVILVSTVRANCKLLDHDAKYDLGFLVDDKRFNVALTRAKAKLVIIGNPVCLERDEKWRKYIKLCTEYKCYFGKSTQQLERTSQMLAEVARTRFDKIRLTSEIKKKQDDDEGKVKRGDNKTK